MDLINHIRFSLINNRTISKDLLWKSLLHTGPQIIGNRRSLKIIHFLRHELEIPLKEFFEFLEAQNWALTEELVELKERWENQEITEDLGTQRSMNEDLIQ